MTDKQQIEEMITIMKNTQCPLRADSEYPIACDECPYQSYEMSCSYKQHAEALYNAGYRKIDENAVVLTREEYEWYRKQCEELNNIYSNGFRTLTEVHKLLEQIHKETTKKFADKLKAYIDNNKHQSYFFGTMCLIDKETVNEIAKQLGVEVEE